MSTLIQSSSQRLGLVGLLGILTALDAIAIDMYLPAMPQMQEHFATSSSWIQGTLAIFLIGLSVGQLVYGPITDRFGRRWPLLIGMACFLAGSLLIVLAPNIHTLLAGRLLQAVGAAAALVIPRAIIADLFDEASAAKMYAMLMVIMSLGPVLAPLAGEMLAEHAGWQSIFLVLSAFGALCLIAIYCQIEESLPPARRQHIPVQAFLGGYMALLKDGQYRRHAFALGLFTASLFTYISGVPFIFIEQHGVSPQHFSLVFAANGIGMAVLSLASMWLSKWLAPKPMVVSGACIHFALLAALLLVQLSGLQTLTTFTLLLGAGVCSLGLIWGNMMALVMAGQAKQAGQASALAGVLQYLFGSLAGVILGLAGSHHVFTMLALMTAAAALALLALARR